MYVNGVGIMKSVLAPRPFQYVVTSTSSSLDTLSATDLKLVAVRKSDRLIAT
jgi:hypothetical protein